MTACRFHRLDLTASYQFSNFNSTNYHGEVSMADKPDEERTERRKSDSERRVSKEDRRGTDRVVTETKPRRKEPNRRSE